MASRGLPVVFTAVSGRIAFVRRNRIRPLCVAIFGLACLLVAGAAGAGRIVGNSVRTGQSDRTDPRSMLTGASAGAWGGAVDGPNVIFGKTPAAETLRGNSAPLPKTPGPLTATSVAFRSSGPPAREPLEKRIGGVRLPFVSNAGQADPAVAYYALTFAGTVYVTKKGEIVYSLSARSKAPERHRLASRAAAKSIAKSLSLTESPLGGKVWVTAGQRAVAQVSYFIGDDPKRWRSGIATHESVSFGEVWPGVNLFLRAHGDNIEKVFTVGPGADPSRIQMRVTGSRSLRVNEAGELVANTSLGNVTFTRPVAYQERDGVRRVVSVAYRARGRQYGFSVGAHDPALPTVIDPLLQATYIGGSGQDFCGSIAIHPATGEIYVTGGTDGDLPRTAGGAQPANENGDAFVARFDATLTTLIQATYLGGDGGDVGRALAIHPTTGEVFVAGDTDSTDLPGTAGGAQPATGGGSRDAFVARLSATLTRLNQATYLGGNDYDFGSALTINPTTGEVFVTGNTSSTDFPGTVGGAQPALNGVGLLAIDAFVARFNATLTTLIQATYLGGSGPDDGGAAIAIHPTTNEVFVTGSTASTDFPGTIGGALPAFGGEEDAFVARFNATLTKLIQATFLGGDQSDQGLAIAIHPTTDEVFVTGLTGSADFPGTAGGAQAANGGGIFARDAFVARLNATLTTLFQATYLGGSDTDSGTALAIDPTSGDVFVAGETSSFDFPHTIGGAQPAISDPIFGALNSFVARLNAPLTTLIQATYLGGSGFDDGVALAIHPRTGEVFVTGDTFSTDFPGTAGGAQPTRGGGNANDGFIARLTPDLTGPVIAPPKITGFSPASGAIGANVVITGTNFSGTNRVTFHGIFASFKVDSAIQITASVPAGATTGPIAVSTPGGTATSTSAFTVRTVVNGLVTLAPLVVSHNSTAVSGGPAGTMTIRATFTNSSSTRIKAPFFVVTVLSGGNLLLNADGAPGGRGAKLTPNVGADGILQPGEAFTTDFIVGRQSRSGFAFFVDLWGEPNP